MKSFKRKRDKCNVKFNSKENQYVRENKRTAWIWECMVTRW